MAQFERASAPHFLEEAGVVRLLDLDAQHLGVGDGLLQRIQEWSLGLLGQRVAQDAAGGPAIPEHAAKPAAFRLIEMEHGAVAGIGRGRRLAVAEVIGERALVDRAARVHQRIRAGEADLCERGRPRTIVCR